jgi:7,8-dihydropterin-6-yl-methyl-4-(beta-D-ribofuranosyl)aminobenzene 5'-phosphate synthase
MAMIKELGFLKEATISILAEDASWGLRPGFDTPCMALLGISMLLELKTDTFEKHILYDTHTHSEPVLHNLKILGKSLGKVSTIFLSHCHFDHTGGLAGVLDAIGRPVPVVCHPEIFRPCFEINPDGIFHIGIVGQSREELERKGAIFTLTREPLNLMTGVTTSGEIERVTSFEELEDLYTIVDGKVVQDHEKDDSAVILNFPEGLVILAGCCHAGIVNTMMQAKRITGVDKIHAVIGGLHLVDASEEKMEKSIEALREVEWVFVGHCTGFDAMRRMANVMGDRFIRIHSGMVIQLPVKGDAPPVSKIPNFDKHIFYRSFSG